MFDPRRSLRDLALGAALLALGACKDPAPPQRDLGGHKPGAHADHDPRHGGAVLMDGDVHFEVVIDPSGAHRLYFTDAVREPLPASSVSQATVTITRKSEEPERLVLAPDPTHGYWGAQGKPVPPDAVARIEFTAKGKDKPYWIDLPVSATGNKPVTGPNGGAVQATGEGKLELVADRAGTFRVWLLDPAGKPRDVAGATARVKVALAGYPEVPLAAAGDHLEGKGPPIEAAHATAVVIADTAGKSETGRFALHLEAAGHQHD